MTASTELTITLETDSGHDLTYKLEAELDDPVRFFNRLCQVAETEQHDG